VHEFIEFLKYHELLEAFPGGEKTVIHATGGGAYKYHELFQKEFDGKI
jgi:pantothenate kinase